LFGRKQHRLAIDVRSNEVDSDSLSAVDRIWSVAYQVVDLPRALTNDEIGDVLDAALAKAEEVVARIPPKPDTE
jgi:hypothetical protein